MPKIIVKKPKDNGPPPEEGLPPWMATFADMVTLLLCFFVLLLSFSNQDKDKFRDVLGSLQNAFGVKVAREEADMLALSPSDLPPGSKKLKTEDKLLLGIILRIKTFLEDDQALRDASGIRAEKDGALLWAENGVLFAPGSVELTAQGRQLLDMAAGILKEYNYNLVVRGHSDDREAQGSRYPSGWELSSARAAMALEYLARRHNVTITRMRAVGYSDTRPMALGPTEADHARNRRLELFFHLPGKDTW